MEKEATEHASEISELRSENLDLSNRLADKELDLLKLKRMALKTNSCEGCKGKKTQGAMTSDFQVNNETDLAFIIAKLEKLATSIDEKTVKQNL